MDLILANIDNSCKMSPILNGVLYNKWSCDFHIKPGILDRPEMFVSNNHSVATPPTPTPTTPIAITTTSPKPILITDNNREQEEQEEDINSANDMNEEERYDIRTPNDFMRSFKRTIEVTDNTKKEVSGLKNYSNLSKGMSNNLWNIDVCRFLSYHLKVVFIYRKKEVCQCEPKPELVFELKNDTVMI